MKKIKLILKVLVAQMLVMLAILVLIEVIGKMHAYLNPGYETLYAIPDKKVGWKMTPNLEYVSTGHHWYENEFRVNIKHNSIHRKTN